MKLSYNEWLDLLKELNGYYEENGNEFYFNCWSCGQTPKQVADYLNQQPEC